MIQKMAHRLIMSASSTANNEQYRLYFPVAIPARVGSSIGWPGMTVIGFNKVDGNIALDSTT